MQFIKLHEVMKMTALSRATIYRYISQGIFPAQVSQGTHAVAWDLTEIEQWFKARVEERNRVMAQKLAKQKKRRR